MKSLCIHFLYYIYIRFVLVFKLCPWANLIAYKKQTLDNAEKNNFSYSFLDISPWKFQYPTEYQLFYGFSNDQLRKNMRKAKICGSLGVYYSVEGGVDRAENIFYMQNNNWYIGAFFRYDFLY